MLKHNVQKSDARTDVSCKYKHVSRTQCNECNETKFVFQWLV